MIVATAGHIDHGKTSLLRSITGVDADRLPEERARGISIDLGFIHAEVAPGIRLSFIDVPGHERFIRNMLAGVGAIDAALLTVAADDGVMPQTVEHLHILDLLGVRHGIVAITKIDLVSSSRQEEVAREVEGLLSGTSLADSETCFVSNRDRIGLDVLGSKLAALASITSRKTVHAGGFRMCIDRAFTVAGHGTVVTGTIISGTASIGDHLVVSPAGHEVRVRGMRVQDTVSTSAHAGDRCALNLSGVSVSEAGRGNWLVAPELHAPGRRIDVLLKVLASETQALVHWTPVHLHVGTADIPARVAIPASEGIPPGCEGFAQLALDRPIPALHGDRFVVRDQSAQRTLGGGLVLDPFAPKRQRRAPLRTAELRMLEQGSATRILAGLLEISEQGVSLEDAARNLNLGHDALHRALHEVDAVVLGKVKPIGVTRTAADLLAVRILSKLGRHHAMDPRSSGMTLDELRHATGTALPSSSFEALVRSMAEQQQIHFAHGLARLREHDTTANPADEQLWRRVRHALGEAGVHVPPIGELAAQLDVPEGTLSDFLHRKRHSGEIMQLTARRFALRETLATVAARAAQLAGNSEDGFFLAGQLRDIIGSGRRVTIYFLEFLDRLGITQRFGDRRRIGKDFHSILGDDGSSTGHERGQS